MSSPEQFIEKVQVVNELTDETVVESVLKQRVEVCRNFLDYQPNLQSFFWVRNNLNFQISHAHNIKYALGYERISSKQSVQLVHRQHLTTFYRICLALNTFCNSGKLGRSVLHFSFVLHLPLRDKNNQYWYIRQRSNACSINQHNQVLQFLSWHDVLRPYHGEPLTFQVYSNQGLRAREIETTIKEQSGYYDQLPFTIRQREILKTYIKMDEPTSETVAQLTGIKKKTVYTHNRDMLHRARLNFGRSFKDIYQLSDFFARHEVFGKLG